MKNISKTTGTILGGFILFLTVLPSETWADKWAKSESLTRTLIHKTKSATVKAMPEASPAPDASQQSPAAVSIFYPTKGQSKEGTCWGGLKIDSNDNVYPIGGNIYKILPDGTLVNGVNDQNFFVSGGGSFWFELDEKGGHFYTAEFTSIRVAPFAEGGEFSTLLPEISNGQAIALGQGPLAGSLFATEASSDIEATNRVIRIALPSLEVSEFASGQDFFFFPETIASAPDGSLYVVNLGFFPARLTKIAPAGEASTFAIGTDTQVSQAIAVDKAGNVYWSQANGINKYDPNGNFLETLPGPPDKPAYGNPMGAAFDSLGNLYIVDNYDCKKIYKYALATTIAVTIDIKPGSSTNAINPKSNAVIPVAILTTDNFDATWVEPLSVKFGSNGARETHRLGLFTDVDRDGDLDLVLHFRTRQTGIECGSTSAVLSGRTFDGQTIQGRDSIKTLGCK